MNRICKSLIGFAAAAAVCVGLGVSGFAENEPYIRENFDSLELENDGTTAGSQKFNQFTLNWTVGQPMSGAPVTPSAKFAGSSLSDPQAQTDTAVKIDITKGASNGYINTSLTGKSLYGKKLRLSFNVMITASESTSYAPMQVDIRAGKDNTQTLIAFRANKQIQSFTKTNGADRIMELNWAPNKWYQVVFDFDTAKNTRSLTINGVEYRTDAEFIDLSKHAFDGDPDAGVRKLLNELRFYVNTGANAVNGCSTYLDDIFFGEAPGEPEPEFAVTDFAFTDGTEKITSASVTDTSVHAKAEVTYPKEVQGQKAAVIGALYEKGVLKSAWLEERDLSDMETSGTETIDLVMDHLTLNADSHLKAFVWSGTDRMEPLSEELVLPVKDESYLYYQNYHYLKPGDALPGVTTTNSPIAALVGTDAAGRQGLAKIQVPKTGSSGYPFMSYGTGTLSEPFVVEYDLLIADESRTCIRKVGFKDDANNATVILLNYRPDGNIRNSADQTAGTYTNGAWAHYKMQVDPVQGTYQYWIDGTEQGSGTFGTGAKLGSLRVTFENKDGNDEKLSNTYIDNMKIYKAE